MKTFFQLWIYYMLLYVLIAGGTSQITGEPLSPAAHAIGQFLGSVFFTAIFYVWLPRFVFKKLKAGIAKLRTGVTASAVVLPRLDWEEDMTG